MTHTVKWLATRSLLAGTPQLYFLPTAVSGSSYERSVISQSPSPASISSCVDTTEHLNILPGP